MMRGRRSLCGTTPSGARRRLGSCLTSLYGRTIQCPAWTNSIISWRTKSANSRADLWDPRRTAWLSSCGSPAGSFVGRGFHGGGGAGEAVRPDGASVWCRLGMMDAGRSGKSVQRRRARGERLHAGGTNLKTRRLTYPINPSDKKVETFVC